MASSQLPNYLLSNRKRLSLSQTDVAFLLGAQDGAKVSRYERFAREPSLETALALEVIYQRPVSELFGGLYQKVEKEVGERAKVGAPKAAQTPSNLKNARRAQIFINLANKSFITS